jgi:hypothetical protein
LVKDTGVGITTLAPLASPSFAGVPTVPTASPGTSTTQIASTAFVGASFVGFGAVSGPASATNNAIALYNGTTGKIIQDSAVLLTSLAPLTSPALMGTPTVPTASPGTNTTQAASTAFVTAAVAVAGSTKSSFSAHNNSVAQSIPNNAFTKLNMSTAVYNVGTNFATSTWTPPAGRLVSIVGSVFFNLTAAGLITVAIFKNGAGYKRGTLINAGIGTQQVTVECHDIPNGTDTYEVWAYQSSGVAQNTDGNLTVTYFQGTSIQA